MNGTEVGAQTVTTLRHGQHMIDRHHHRVPVSQLWVDSLATEGAFVLLFDAQCERGNRVGRTPKNVCSAFCGPGRRLAGSSLALERFVPAASQLRWVNLGTSRSSAAHFGAPSSNRSPRNTLQGLVAPSATCRAFKDLASRLVQLTPLFRGTPRTGGSICASRGAVFTTVVPALVDGRAAPKTCSWNLSEPSPPHASVLGNPFLDFGRPLTVAGVGLTYRSAIHGDWPITVMPDEGDAANSTCDRVRHVGTSTGFRPEPGTFHRRPAHPLYREIAA